MQTLQEEVSRLVRGHLRTAGYGPPQSVSSFADIQVIHNDSRSLLGAFICVILFYQPKYLHDYTVVSLDTHVTAGGKEDRPHLRKGSQCCVPLHPEEQAPARSGEGKRSP